MTPAPMTATLPLSAFTAGMLTMGFLVGAAFFLRFWRTTRDGLFIAFAAGFALLALNFAIPTLIRLPDSRLDEVFVLRVAAFVLIGGAVLRRNTPTRR